MTANRLVSRINIKEVEGHLRHLIRSGETEQVVAEYICSVIGKAAIEDIYWSILREKVNCELCRRHIEGELTRSFSGVGVRMEQDGVFVHPVFKMTNYSELEPCTLTADQFLLVSSADGHNLDTKPSVSLCKEAETTRAIAGNDSSK